MANAYSQPQTYLPYIPTTDINLVNTVLGAKQEKYDAGVAEIDALLQEFGGLDIAKSSDKEYLYGKLQTLTDSVNKYGKLNFGNKDVTRNIKSYIKGALDERVVGAIADTSKYRSYQAMAEQAREKGEYSDLNYQVGLMKAGFADWMNDDSGQSRLGNLAYTPYVDVNAELMKKLKEASSIKGGKRVMQIRDTTGQLSGTPGTIIEKSIDGLTQPEIAALIPTLLDGKSRDQLRVNGYYRYQGDKESAVSALRQTYDGKIKNIDTNITNLQTKINSGKASPAQIQQYKTQISALEGEKTKSLKTIDTIAQGDAGFIGGYLEEENLKNSLSYALQAQESVEYMADQAYFKNLESKAKERKASFSASGGVNGVTSIPGLSNTKEEEINIFDKVQERGRTLSKDLTQTINRSYNNLTPDQKTRVDSLMQGPEYESLDDKGKRMRAMKESGFLDPEDEGRMNSLDRRYKAFLEDDQRLYNESLTSTINEIDLWDDIQDDGFLGNGGIKIVDPTTGTIETYKQYLSNRGIQDKESYTEFIESEDSKDFKLRVLADDLLSSNVNSSVTQPFSRDITGALSINLGRVLGNEGDVTAGVIDKDLLTRIERMAAVSGENIELTDIFDVYEVGTINSFDAVVTGGLSLGTQALNASEPRLLTMAEIRENQNSLGRPNTGHIIKLKDSAKNSAVGRVIIGAFNAGTYDRKPLGNNLIDYVTPDNSVQDDPTFRKALSLDRIEEKYTELVNSGGVRIRGGNEIAIPAALSSTKSNPAFEGIRSAMAHARPLEGVEDKDKLTALKYGASIAIRRSLNDPQTFIVSQSGKTTTIPARAIMNQPGLTDAINFEENVEQLVLDDGKPLIVKGISYKDSTAKNNVYLANNYGTNTDQYLAATREGALRLIEKDYGAIFSDNADPAFANTFKDALNNASNFEVRIQQYRGTNYAEVYYQGDKIGDIATAASKEQLARILDYDPQIFITSALRNIATQLKNGNQENFGKLYGNLYGQQ